MITLKTKGCKVFFAALASIIGYVAWWNVYRITPLLDLPKHTVINSVAKDLVMVILALMILLIVLKPKDICSFLGLDSNLLKGFLVAIVSVLPLYIVFPLIGSINQDYSVSLFIRRCVCPGFFEEFLCRAFMFGLFFRYAKVGFFWATILPAIGFGIMHIYQGHDILSSLAAFGVTFLGALYFSWMYVAWNYNLLVPIGLHLLMNTAWGIFNVTGTEVAAGGLISNIMRIVSITLAITITVYYHRKKGEKVFDYPVFSF